MQSLLVACALGIPGKVRGKFDYNLKIIQTLSDEQQKIAKLAGF
jgi:hypothetical protein